jgi:hypothetical protein
MRRRITAAATAGIVVAAAVTAVVATSGDPAATARAATPESLATVRRGTLTAQVSQSGTLGYAAHADGSPYSLLNQASGPYTRLPAAGDVVRCGEVLYRVADRPVVLLCGGTPSYRALHQGMTGPDVWVLNRNLVRLGYAEQADVQDAPDAFGAATADALGDLQEDLGADRTEALRLGDVVVAPRSVRVTRIAAREGATARPGTPMGEATSTRRSVEVDLDPSQAAGVRAGDLVQVTLPDNRTAEGEVSHVGTVAQAAGEEGSPATTIPASIRLRRARDARGLDGAPVRVQITIERIRDALSVPLTALLARPGGGYAVETAGTGGAHALVPVEIGLVDHAAGEVEVTGEGLQAGLRVVVPGA